MKNLFFSILLLWSSTSLVAQEITVNESFMKQSFWEHWFISAGGGANIYFGDGDSDASFGKRLAPALDISVGKWIVPSLGLRIQYAGLSAKGVTNGTSPYADLNSPMNGLYKKDFNVLNLHTDVLFNVSNFFKGYNPDRHFDFIPFGGFGWAKSFNDDDVKNELALTAGLLNKYKLNDMFDLNLELRGMLVNRRFDRVSEGRSPEGMTTASLGLTYKFNRSKKASKKLNRVHPWSTSESDVVGYHGGGVSQDQFTDEIKRLEAENQKHIDIIKRLTDELAKQPSAPSPTVVKEALGHKMSVFFNFDSSELSAKDQINLTYLAKVLNQSSSKYKLTGYADNLYGSAAYNKGLSLRRVKAVYDFLLEQGVPESKLEIVSYDGSEQVYPQVRLNRVVVLEPIK